MRTTQQILTVCTLWLAVAGPTLGAGGGSAPAPPAAPQLTPEQQAAEAYNAGLRFRDQAWELEKELDDATTDADRVKIEKKIAKAFGKAEGQFERAVRLDPNLYQAHSSLGYARRRLGDYEQSLAAYDRALELNPNYSEAIEYRAEAYLALGRIAEAKDAHARLTALDRAHADQLLAAIQVWLVERRRDPQGIDPAQLDELAAWLEQRQQLAEKTASLAGDSLRPW